MKRLSNVLGYMLGLLIVGLLILAVSLSYQGLTRDNQLPSSAFKSPIQSPTPRPVITPTPRADLPPAPISTDLTDPIQLTTRPDGRSGLDADGDVVVWQERDPDGYMISIIAYDLRSRAERTIKSLPPGGKDTQRSFASYPRVSGHYIVWAEYYQATERFVPEIHAFDLTRENELVLGEGVNPDIAGNRIVWYDPWTDADHPTMLYELPQQRVQRLPIRGGGAKIWGTWIIYSTTSRDQKGGQADLHLYNLQTSEDILLGKLIYSLSTPPDDYYAIDEGLVVWAGDRTLNVYEIARRSQRALNEQWGPVRGAFSKGVLLRYGRALNLLDGTTFQTFEQPSSHRNRWGESVADYLFGEVVNDGEILIWTACTGAEDPVCTTNHVFLARRRR